MNVIDLLRRLREIPQEQREFEVFALIGLDEFFGGYIDEEPPAGSLVGIKVFPNTKLIGLACRTEPPGYDQVWSPIVRIAVDSLVASGLEHDVAVMKVLEAGAQALTDSWEDPR